MTKLFAVLLFIVLLATVPLSAADLNDQLTVEFAFDQAPNPDRFKLYRDGQLVCQSPDGIARSFDCNVPPLPYGPSNWTMTAVSGSRESPVSPVYVFEKGLKAPAINRIVTISVTVQ